MTAPPRDTSEFGAEAVGVSDTPSAFVAIKLGLRSKVGISMLTVGDASMSCTSVAAGGTTIVAGSVISEVVSRGVSRDLLDVTEAVVLDVLDAMESLEA